MEQKKKVLFLQGNEACAEGAIAAGVNFFAGYPITPATEIAEALSKRIPQTGGRFIQMEDELACMGAVCGASLAGAKAMTATSGPGFTLLQENIGFAAISEIPCVIVDVQRGGPSTGLPTMSSQADVMQARWGTHGDHPVIVLAPSSVSESFYLTIECFNLAEKYRVPVILLSDAIIGHMRERISVPEYGSIKTFNRIKPERGLAGYKPYDATGARTFGVPPMADLGDGYRHYISGCVHDETGSPKMGSNTVARALVARLCDKVTKNRDEIVRCESQYTADAEVLVLAYGSVARPALSAVAKARAEGKKVGFFRPISIWPSPDREILAAAERARSIIIPEMNYGQYAGEVARVLGEAGKATKIVKVDELGSETIRPERIYDSIQEECK
jgi:2-oxoglutarate ferredoxin oxidoreductase subunit alpha